MEQSKRRFIILSAPSGSGKTTLAKALLDRFPHFAFSVSATTRPPRDYEKEGVHYYFLSPDTFRRKIEKGDFLEYEEVYKGRYYGTLKSEIDRISAVGKIPILDVDVVGGLNIKKQYSSDALAVFIKAPSIEVLKERLRKRNADSEEEIQLRIDKAREEMGVSDEFDLIIVNDDLEEATRKLSQAALSFVEKRQIP